MPDPILSPEEQREGLEHLKALIRMDTSNPPGREGRVAAYLAGVLDRERVPYELVEGARGRGMLVARLSAAPDRAGPDNDGLLLSAHMDVVPADPVSWTHPPFRAIEADGCVWGRGAVDMKHMLAASLMAIVTAKRHGWTLERDLVFAAVADEEEGCENGSLYLAREHPGLLRARYCLTEVGGFTLQVGSRTLVPVGVGTKGFAWLRVKARGEPGHGSLPDPDSAPSRLLKALAPIAEGVIETRLCSPAAAFIAAVASSLPFPGSLVVRGLTFEALIPRILNAIPDAEQARYFRAITHDTAAVTILKAGTKENVVPDCAEALLDVRVLPGRSVREVVEDLSRRLGDRIEVEVLRSAEPTESAWPGPLWNRIERAVRASLPSAQVVPYLISGFTDAIAYARLGITTYGFAPIRLPPDLKFSRLFHGVDERIPVDGFFWGLETLCDVVRRHVTGAE